MNFGLYNTKIFPYAEIRVVGSESNIIFADSSVQITIFTPYLKFWAYYDDIVFVKDLNIIYEYNPFYNRNSSSYKEGNIFMTNNNSNVIFLMNFSSNYNIAEWIVLYRKKSVHLTILTFSVLLKVKPFLEIKWKPFLQDDNYIKKEGKSIIISCEVKNYSTFNIEHLKFQFPSETLFQKTIYGQYLIRIFLTLMPNVVNKTLNCSFGPWIMIDNSILQFPLNPAKKEIVVKEELMLSSLIVSGVLIGIMLLIIFYFYRRNKERETRIRKRRPSFMRKSLFLTHSQNDDSFKSRLRQMSFCRIDTIVKPFKFL